MTCLDGFGGPSDRAPRAAIREAPWIESENQREQEGLEGERRRGLGRDDPQPAPRDEEAEEGERAAPGHGRLPMLDVQAEASELAAISSAAPLRLGPGRRGAGRSRRGPAPARDRMAFEASDEPLVA